MKPEKLFSDKLAVKIWVQYFRRVTRCARTLDPHQQEDLRLEIQDHLFESFKNEVGESEAERLLQAIDKMGDPEEFIKPMVAEKLLTSASKTLNPKTILKGLYYYLFGSIKHTFMALFFFVGYLAVFTLGIMALLKPFFPDYVGLFIYDQGGHAFGVSVDTMNMRTEVLGYWIVPVGLMLSSLLYFGLTKFLKVLKNK